MNNIIVPNHVGIIMDGNRRWAKEKNKKTIEGHLAGANRIISLAKYIFDKGVKYLSIYAFSTENFNRSAEEVSYLMGLIIKFFNERVHELHDYNIKIVVSGLRDNLSKDVLKCIDGIKGEIVLVVSGNLDDNDFSDLSLKEHVELYLDDGLSEKEAIKRVAFERKIQKSIVYKEYHLNK